MAAADKTESKNENDKAPPAPQVAKERRYRVLETIGIPHNGAHYTLRQGKILSNHGYDIPALKNHGAKLEEVA